MLTFFACIGFQRHLMEFVRQLNQVFTRLLGRDHPPDERLAQLLPVVHERTQVQLQVVVRKLRKLCLDLAQLAVRGNVERLGFHTQGMVLAGT